MVAMNKIDVATPLPNSPGQAYTAFARQAQRCDKAHIVVTHCTSAAHVGAVPFQKETGLEVLKGASCFVRKPREMRKQEERFLMLKIPSALGDRFKAICAANNTNQSAMIRGMIQAYLEKHSFLEDKGGKT